MSRATPPALTEVRPSQGPVGKTRGQLTAKGQRAKTFNGRVCLRMESQAEMKIVVKEAGERKRSVSRHKQ